MKRQLGPIFTALMLLCAPIAWSQTFTDSVLSAPASPVQVGSTDPTQTGSDSGNTPQDNVPLGILPDNNPPDNGQPGSVPTGPQDTFTHPEQLPALNVFSEAVTNTGLRLSLQSGVLEEYVTGGTNYNHYWQNFGLFGGGIQVAQIRNNMSFILGYNGGVTLNSLSIGGSYVTLNQTANGKFVWRLAKRWQLRMKDQYLYSDNPFEPFLTYVGDPTPNNPNPIIYFPQAIVEQNQASADLTYQLGPHDSIDFSGNESFQRYLRGNLVGLWNSYTYTGGAFYQHEISPQLAVGGGWSFSALDFGHGQSRAGVNMIEGFITYKFRPGFTVSAWVGPELTDTKNLIPIFCSPYGCLIEEQHNSVWDVAEGGNVNWVKHKNAIRGQFSHRVTDGGGILGAVGLYQVGVGYSRALAHDWGFGMAAMYSTSNSISHFRANQYLNSAQGTLSFTRKISDAWNANLYYVLIHQSQNYYGLPGKSTANGLGITLRYVWGHTLGR